MLTIYSLIGSGWGSDCGDLKTHKMENKYDILRYVDVHFVWINGGVHDSGGVYDSRRTIGAGVCHFLLSM